MLQKVLFSSFIERALNQALALDLQKDFLVERINDLALCVNITDFNTHLCIIPQKDALCIKKTLKTFRTNINTTHQQAFSIFHKKINNEYYSNWRQDK